MKVQQMPLSPPLTAMSAMTLLLLSVSSLANAQPAKRLWVLQQPNRIVEYDPATFEVRSSNQIPAEIFQSPHDLQINRKGQMLFLPASQSDGLTGWRSAARWEVLLFFRSSDVPTFNESTSKVWFWDGSSAKFLNRRITNSRVPSGGNVLVSTVTPRCYLSADGAHLFWFENRHATVQTPDTGLGISVETTFHAWQTDLAGQHPEEIGTYTFAPCECDTTVCSETCPEADYWFPDAGVDHHFITTNWFDGQLQAHYQASFLYRKSVGGWLRTELPHAMERVMDSSSDGGGLMLIEAIRDKGCCGLVNASDDQTLLTRNGKSIVLFDEFQQYQNQDFDISFFTTNAQLSPHATLAALTVIATNPLGEEIPPPEFRKPDAKELSRIQQALAELPVAEVLRLDDPPKRVARIPRAWLVGWINDQEVLLIENDFLVSFNVVSGKRRTTEIKVPKVSYALLR